MNKVIALICAAVCLGFHASAVSAVIIDFDRFDATDGNGLLYPSETMHYGLFLLPLDGPQETLSMSSENACRPGVFPLMNSLLSRLEEPDATFEEFAATLDRIRAMEIDSGCSRDSFVMEVYDFNRALLASAADCLFNGNKQSGNTSYYIDSATLCVAVSGIRYISILPEADGNFGTIFDELMYEFQKAAAPVPEPTTMFLLGLGLIGLSGLRKRKKK